ncbi:Crossover junction endonuclease eme1 [Madurella mycetomatis]|uniref:Crossover junction endonuclease eme1 n=1 Tax=Madurella mycetomatis TaxID=100816 RepID=A0A175WGS2_9PEZI|nr:Crossover junction endonuclease eme1 [Madurella mycetomatis]
MQPTCQARLNSAHEPPRGFFDDPFASSSPPKGKAYMGANAQRSRRLLDDLDDSFASSSPRGKENVPEKTGIRQAIIEDIDLLASSSPGPVISKQPQNAAAWDPISSSAPLPPTVDDDQTDAPRSLRRIRSEAITLDDSDNDYPAKPDSEDEFPDIAGLAASRRTFTSLTEPTLVPSKPSKRLKSTGARSISTEPKKTPQERLREREEKAAARETERERKKLEKERARADRARQKATAAALAEVNKIRTDKKVSTPEMIVDLPSTLDEATRMQAEILLKDLDVSFTSWSSPVDNVVKWRRKVRSQYNDELGHWEPIPERIERENYAMVILSAPQFVDLALGADNTTNLEAYALRMRRNFPTDTIIYLIEGLEPWLRKNRNLRNLQFVSAVRSGLEPPPPQQADEPPTSSQPNKPRRRKNNPSTQQQQPPQRNYIDTELIDTALLHLQVLHPSTLIHHTTVSLETARWIAIFTQHISTVPYRRQRDTSNDANFCIESGQVRTGETPRETYLRMLQEIGRVTAPIAYGIAAECGTVSELVKRLKDGGPLALEKIRKGTDRNGGVSDRVVGQAVSKRLWRIFTGRDEGSMDV